MKAPARRPLRSAIPRLHASMVELARRRLPAGTRVERHDLNEPLARFDDESFDVVLSALVHGHLHNRVGFVNEAFRVLRPGGRFVISTHHPTSDWLTQGGSYFAVEQFVARFNSDAGVFEVPSWRMPLHHLVDELLSTGFILEKIAEPRPTAVVEQIDPEVFEQLSTAPAFIAFRLRKP